MVSAACLGKAGARSGLEASPEILRALLPCSVAHRGSNSKNSAIELRIPSELRLWITRSGHSEERFLDVAILE